MVNRIANMWSGCVCKICKSKYTYKYETVLYYQNFLKEEN